MSTQFYGTGIAMVTPFHADRTIDFPALKKLVDFLIDGKVEYLVSLGTTGESATLSKDEKKEVWRFTAEAVAGRVPLVAGIGSNNTTELVDSLSHFDTAGFDAVLSVSPFYNKPIQEGIYQHYKLVAEASPLPVILYNVPSRTGSNMTAETTLRLANDFKNVIAVKEASGNFDQFNAILRDKPEDFLFISGDDPVTFPLMSMGAAGVISVIGNALPGMLSEMVRLCLDMKFKEAAPLHFDLLEITRLLFAEGSPGGVKSALKTLGICGDTLRLPLVNVSNTLDEAVAREIERLG
ncbi:4-hydroxy-tetrahydrodipicolinate synthase [Hufsiella ginkgonis]|uniref:4-hydroxy-tetrahydrodipicolinate synthase n=1 Tax=Hufsiella ginkgonis TaxID=2695274 RepID=A0A7K1XSG2_9SPHI|nr:4-hydroxy-tetrahydrodipicolinate synthase [Hufsiella ginkgonis]MXV13838.1 4-hydroxy-tetrahydrodipicolinate synthase [Hufsiella ginkgonis]